MTVPARDATRRLAAAAAGVPESVAAAVLLLVLVAALYAGAFGRGFTSEDFLLVRYLGEHRPWLDLRAQLEEPWLGIRGIEFFRPVSTLLYSLEIAAFGADPRGYMVVHVLGHWLAALLLFGVARELVRRQPAMPGAAAAPWLAAILFAVHPLHPNAVVFAASFATLFGGILALLTLYAYERHRAGRGLGWWLASLASFCLALGCYEATAVVPLWLVARDQLLAAEHRGRTRLAVSALPFLAVLAAYFGWRHLVFARFIGGYAATRERFGDPVALAKDAATSLGRLHLPLHTRPDGRAMVVLVVLAVLAGLAFLRRRGPHQTAAGPWALGWVIAVSSMAPFAFEPVVPANGRYWYLAAAGAAIGLAFLAAALSARLGGGIAGRLPWAAIAVVAVFWAAGLVATMRDVRRAADIAGDVHTELVRAAARPRPPGRLFVTGYPYFLTNRAGVNLAQVYHYGLRDAVRPPFHSPAIDIYPLTPLAGVELLPVTLAAPGRVLAWDARSARMRPAPTPAAGDVRELSTLAAAATARIPGARVPAMVGIRIPEGPYDRFRLLLSAPINGTVVDLGAGRRHGDVLLVELPADFLRTSRQLYGGGPIFWWVEARDATGRLTGFTRMRRVGHAARIAAG